MSCLAYMLLCCLVCPLVYMLAKVKMLNDPARRAGLMPMTKVFMYLLFGAYFFNIAMIS